MTILDTLLYLLLAVVGLGLVIIFCLIVVISYLGSLRNSLAGARQEARERFAAQEQRIFDATYGPPKIPADAPSVTPPRESLKKWLW